MMEAGIGRCLSICPLAAPLVDFLLPSLCCPPTSVGGCSPRPSDALSRSWWYPLTDLAVPLPLTTTVSTLSQPALRLSLHFRP